MIFKCKLQLFFLSASLIFPAIMVLFLWEVLMVGYLVVRFVILALLLYVFVLRKNIAHLQTEYKNLLQESRAQTSNEQRNKENIYLHLNQNFLITYMNDTACQFFNINKGDWLNLPALGTIMEDTAANFDYLKQALAKVSRNPETLNEEAVILTSDKKKLPMKIRIRPMLDGTLACVGLSIVLRDVSEASSLQRKLTKLKNRDTLVSTILNQEALFKKMDKEFGRCKRYNQEFSMVVVEMRAIYDFICQGIDFDRGDKLFVQTAQICSQIIGKSGFVGRYDKTRFALVMPKAPRELSSETAQNLYYPLVKMIQSLGIDRTNAEMIIISYTNRKNFSDTPDGMLGRVNAHIDRALKQRDYGIKSSDRK